MSVDGDDPRSEIRVGDRAVLETSSFGVVAVWKRPWLPTTLPGVPFSIRPFATSTVTGSFELLTLSRYRWR